MWEEISWYAWERRENMCHGGGVLEEVTLNGRKIYSGSRK